MPENLMDGREYRKLFGCGSGERKHTATSTLDAWTATVFWHKETGSVDGQSPSLLGRRLLFVIYVVSTCRRNAVYPW